MIFQTINSLRLNSMFEISNVNTVRLQILSLDQIKFVGKNMLAWTFFPLGGGGSILILWLKINFKWYLNNYDISINVYRVIMTENPSFVTSMLFTLIFFVLQKRETVSPFLLHYFFLMQPPHGSIIYNQKNINIEKSILA